MRPSGRLRVCPAALFDEAVIRSAGQGEVVDVGLAVVGDPAVDVMDLGPWPGADDGGGTGAEHRPQTVRRVYQTRIQSTSISAGYVPGPGSPPPEPATARFKIGNTR